jgi:hypothetical protein
LKSRSADFYWVLTFAYAGIQWLRRRENEPIMAQMPTQLGKIVNLKVIPEIYIDTSVFGGHTLTKSSLNIRFLFLKDLKGESILLFSAVTQDELENASEKVKDVARQIHSPFYTVLKTSDEPFSR